MCRNPLRAGRSEGRGKKQGKKRRSDSRAGGRPPGPGRSGLEGVRVRCRWSASRSMVDPFQTGTPTSRRLPKDGRQKDFRIRAVKRPPSEWRINDTPERRTLFFRAGIWCPPEERRQRSCRAGVVSGPPRSPLLHTHFMYPRLPTLPRASLYILIILRFNSQMPRNPGRFRQGSVRGILAIQHFHSRYPTF